MKQVVKEFYCGAWPGKSLVTETLEEQVNNHMKEHPDYMIKEIAALMGASYKELFIVFDIQEKPERKPNTNFKGDKS